MRKSFGTITLESRFNPELQCQTNIIYEHIEPLDYVKMQKRVEGNTSNNTKDPHRKQKTPASQHLLEEKKHRKRKWNKETKRQSGFPTDDGKMVFRPYTWFLALPGKK